MAAAGGSTAWGHWSASSSSRRRAPIMSTAGGPRSRPSAAERPGVIVKSMPKSATLQQARAAKAKVVRMVGDHPEVNGVGITRVGDGYVVKLNLSSPNGKTGLPKQIDGVPVRVET